MLAAGVHKIRRDITLSLFQGDRKKLVIVIEAKNAGLYAKAQEVNIQLAAWVQRELAARIKNYITQRIQGDP